MSVLEIGGVLIGGKLSCEKYHDLRFVTCWTLVVLRVILQEGLLLI